MIQEFCRPPQCLERQLKYSAEERGSEGSLIRGPINNNSMEKLHAFIIIFPTDPGPLILPAAPFAFQIIKYLAKIRSRMLLQISVLSPLLTCSYHLIFHSSSSQLYVPPCHAQRFSHFRSYLCLSFPCQILAYMFSNFHFFSFSLAQPKFFHPIPCSMPDLITFLHVLSCNIDRVLFIREHT